MSYFYEDIKESYSLLCRLSEEDFKEERLYHWPPQDKREIEGEEIQLILAEEERKYKIYSLEVIKTALENSIQIYFPDFEGLEFILLHYYTERQIKRIKDLVCFYQENDTLPKMEDEEFIVVVAVSHLFAVFMIEDFEEVFQTIDNLSEITGFLYIDDLKPELIHKYSLVSDSDYHQGDRYVVKINDIVLGMDTPTDINCLLAEFMPYKNKYGWKIDTYGFSNQSLEFEQAFTKDWLYSKYNHTYHFEEYLEYWRK